MKVGIVTINNGENYGNRLQNYALQEVLKELGCNVETIRNITGQTPINYSSIKWKIKEGILRIYLRTNKNDIFALNKMFRHIKFRDFTEKFIKQSDFIISKDNIHEDLAKKYDYFISGSDQVWNPNFFFNSHIEFLTFAKTEQRISYAASFGVNEIPNNNKNEYKNWLSGMGSISVREESGAKIVKDLIGKTPSVVVDPTMLLDKEKWIEFSKKPYLKLEKRFILTYFLGEVEDEIKHNIEKISKKYNLQIINLLDEENKFIYSVDPCEFIWLINNCELMCTDSFHGAVFSLIMKTPFIVFERKSKGASMNSRLETLLSKFSMEDRLYKNIVNDEEIFSVDFSRVDEIISFERKKTSNYLKKALNIK